MTDRRPSVPMLEYRIRGCTGWLLMRGCPGQSNEQAAEQLRRRFGERLVTMRVYGQNDRIGGR